MAAEIRRKDIIEEEAIKAPRDLGDALKYPIDQIDIFIGKLKDFGKVSSIPKVKKEIEEITLEQKELVKIQQQIAVAEAKNNDAYREQQKALQKVKDTLKEKNAIGERDAKTINRTNASIKELTAALAKNRKAYDDLANDEERASQAGQELLKVINEQDAALKEIKGSTGRFQENVGNYPTQLGKAEAAFETLTPAVSNTAKSITVATKAALAFIATPLGAVLALLALALAPIVSYLKSTGDGMDLVEKKTSGLKNGLKVLQDEFNEIGRDILDSETKLGAFVSTLIKSNPIVLAFTSQIAVLKKAFPDLAKKFDEAQAAGERYADTMDNITTEQAFFNVEADKEENAIKRLVLQAKNRAATEEERIEIIDEALAKESALSLKRVDFANQELGALVNLARTRVKITQEANETEEEFAVRLARSLDKTDNELRDQLLSSLRALEQARGEDIAITEKLQNQRDALLDKAEEKEKKRQEDRLKLQERINNAIFELEQIQLQRDIRSAPNVEARVKKEIELEDLRVKHLLGKAGLLAEERQVIEQEHVDKVNDIRKKGAQDSVAEAVAAAKKIGDAFIKEQQARLDKEVNAVKKAVIAGTITREEGEKKIVAIKKGYADDIIQAQIDSLSKILQIEGLSNEERAAIDQELYKLKNDLVDAYYNNVAVKQKTQLEKDIEFISETKRIYEDFAGAINNLFSSITDRRLSDIDRESKAEEDRLKRDLELAGDNEEAKKEIQEASEKRQQELEKKRIEAQRRAAIFDKASALVGAAINTALAVVNQLAKGDPYTAFARAALAGALGAIQIAAIAAKPIPRYAEGGVHGGGIAMVGEEGTELMNVPGRGFILTPSSSTLMDLPKGTEIIPHEDTMRMLALSSMNNSARIDSENAMLYNKLDSLEKTIKASDERIVQAIINSSNGDLMEEAGFAYRIKQKQDGSRKKIRLKSLNE